MADHDDLFAAALEAVNAVHKRSAGDKVKTAVVDPLEPDPLNAECVDDDLDLNLSMSAFDRILDEAVEEVENEKNTQDAEFTGLDISMSDSEIPEVENPAAPAAEPEQTQTQTQEFSSQLAACKAELEAAKQAVKKANEENEQLRASQRQLNDRLVRLTADFDNYRKRVTRDQDQMRHQAEERIVTSFLSVMDNLERALAHAKSSSDYDQLLQGVELTSRMYLSTLAKHGCVPYNSMGEVCDPVYHDVLQRVVDNDVPHNTIVQEHLKGYKMHDHVVRPALVVVAQHDDGEGEAG